MPIPLNIQDLLSARTVESDRIEYKEGWNPDAIYRSIGAFANDFENMGGGYILIGVAENPTTKTAVRPVKGLTTKEIGTIQQDMVGFNNQIRPYYAPKLFIEQIDGKDIIVLWVIAGNERPYEVPENITNKAKSYKYFIRRYASSIEAKGVDKEELISLSNNIPFDDRSNSQAEVDNISMMLVKDYLVKVKSKLVQEVYKISNTEILRQMELVSGPPERVFPRNVALMLFSEQPHKYFPYTQVEIVEFPNGEANPYIETEPIKGPIPSQISRTLEILKDKIVREKVIKPTDRAESIRIASYPLQAIEEVLVNAFYHRDYQQREPIEIRIYTNSIVFINQGGLDRSIQLQALNSGAARSRRYRNRRLGEFLKELELTEGRATGIPTILKTLEDNGSAKPRFNTDDYRSFFEVELFIHPAFKIKEPFSVDLDKVIWNLQGINNLLNQMLEYVDIDVDDTANALVNALADTIASTIAEIKENIDNQVIKVIDIVDSTIAGTIADAIANALVENEIKLLTAAENPIDRKDLMKTIGLKNLRKSYDTHVKKLEDIGWLAMTIPDKPTSPKQQYLTTLKGRLVLGLLKYKK